VADVVICPVGHVGWTKESWLKLASSRPGLKHFFDFFPGARQLVLRSRGHTALRTDSGSIRYLHHRFDSYRLERLS
jgi:hypothetical protein